MLENALTMRNLSVGRKITCKTLVSAGLIALAVVLPQLVHLAAGASGGVKWLPMYLPVLIGGCLMGARWGLAAGVLSPLASFAVTTIMGNPMPAAARLPFMVAELAVFALVAGLFTRKIADRAPWAFPAVIAAQLAGRAVFMGLVALFQGVTPFTPAMIWQQICTGLWGLAAQAVLVPVVIIMLRALMLKERGND